MLSGTYLPLGGSNFCFLDVVVALAVAGGVEEFVDGFAAPGCVQVVEILGKALPGVLLPPRVEGSVGLVGSVNQAQSRESGLLFC